MAYQRGIASATITVTGFTTFTTSAILESISIKASGKKETLAGNNEGQKIVDTFTSEIEQTADLTFETESNTEFPSDLINLSVSVSVTTDASQGHTSCTYTFSGVCTDCTIDITKTGWHTYKITLSNVEGS